MLITLICFISLSSCTGLKKDGKFPQAAADKNILKKIHNGIMDLPTSEIECIHIGEGEHHCYHY